MNRYIFFTLLLFSCSPVKRINIDDVRKEILDLNAKQRDYHFFKNAKGISDLSSTDFLLVDNGVVSQPKREDQFKMFDAYFKPVEFIKWDDIKEPVIRFSKDATVAYVAVEKEVIIKGFNKTNREVTDTSHFAWISIYKRGKNGWELDAIASTRKAKK